MSKVLIFDVENTPSLGWTWGKYEQNVLEFEQEWYMLSFAYKWLDKKTTKVLGLPDFDGYDKDRTNDKKLVQELWNLLDEAEFVIGHNVDAFDVKKANARFLFHGMNPPTPYHTIDTLKIARRYFKMNSNRLTDIATYLGIGEKIDTGGFKLWLDCMAGDKKGWNLMKAYNKEDVNLTERVYLKLRHWMTNHPNLNVLDGKLDSCPICSSTNIQRRGFATTRVSKYQRWQCTDCGGWSKSIGGKTVDIR